MESWRNRKTLILGRTDMMGLLTPVRVQRLRRARLPDARPRPGLHGAEGAHRPRPLPGRVGGHAVLHRGARRRRARRADAAACKWVSIREDNATYELPAVFSILVYTHPETGFPLAICDGSYHTLMRTGASAAVSAKWLARKDSRVLAIAGTGSVGQGTLATCDPVFPWEEVRIWSRTQASLDRFLAVRAAEVPAPASSPARPTSSRSCAAPT